MTSDNCPNCGKPLTSKRARPYPVIIQILFLGSFIAFWIYSQKLKYFNPTLIWSWSAVQMILGIILIRGRFLARKTILHCLHCHTHLE